jgi:NAD(P)-dependent dehydrogenase (short-subunit alcohol dehydrogenase family)
MSRLNGKAAVVSGAARGIGAAAAVLAAIVAAVRSGCATQVINPQKLELYTEAA